MITEEERSEVAKRLRKTLCNPGSLGDWWMRVHEAVAGSENCLCPPEDVSVIADLIDWPTCRNNGDRDDRDFVCSACGYGAWTFYDSNCDPSDFSFCPDCGAEVVEDD